MRSWGLKSRLLFSTLALFAAAGILSFGLYLATARRIAWDLGTQFAVTNTRLAAMKISSFIDREVVLAQALANSPTVKAWILDEDNAAKEGAARAELESYRRAFRDKSYFVAVAESGNYYNQPAEGVRALVHLSRSQPSDQWFFRSIAAGADWSLNLDYNPHIHTTKVWINCAVREGNRVIGLAGGGIDLSSFVANIAAEAREGLSIVLVDAEGTITAYRDIEYLERNATTWSETGKLTAADLVNAPQDRETLRGILAGLPADPDAVRTARIGRGGEGSLVAASYIPDLKWSILAFVDLDRLVAAKNFAPILAVLLGALVLSLAALAVVVDRLILRPLGDLTAAAGAVARGRYDLALPGAGVGEIGTLSTSFTAMALAVRRATEGLEAQVAERTLALGKANARMREDLEYARIVQSSLLPSPRNLDRLLPGAWALFRPRDQVGGDFYFCRERAGSVLLGLVDCTGHGVSGALMTMFTGAALEEILATPSPLSPTGILAELDRQLRSGERQEMGGLGAERGVDAAVCLLEPKARRLVYAGAGIDLFIVGTRGAERIKSDRGSIGSRRRPSGAKILERDIDFDAAAVYLTSDGFLDQAGGPRGFGFGGSRFTELVASLAALPFSEQRTRLESVLEEWRGPYPQRDDITVFAFIPASVRGMAQEN